MKKALLILFLLCASPAFALTYYVSKSGTDTNCTTIRTIGTPALTLEFAFGCMAGGDTLYIRGGTWDEAIHTNSQHGFPPNGSAGAPTYVKSYPSETVIFRTIQNDPWAGIFEFDATNHYITFDGGSNRGIIFDGTIAPGSLPINFEYPMWKVAGANHITLTNFEARNLADGWFSNTAAPGGHDNTVSNGSIHDSYPAYLNFLAGSSGCGQVICWGYPFYWDGTNGIIDNVEIYNVPSFGVHLYCYIAPTYCNNPDNFIVRSVKVHDFGSVYWPTTPSGGQGPGDPRATAILMTRGVGNKAYNNIIYRGTQGIGLGLGSSSSLVANNTIYSMLTTNGATGVGIATGDDTTSFIRNNVISSNTGGAISNDSGGNTFSNNRCYNSVTVSNCASTSNPLFIDPTAGNFQLQAGSPAIGTGMDLSATFTTDYTDAIRTVPWTTGAYKFTSGTPVVVKLPSSPTGLKLGSGTSINIGLAQ